MKGRSPGRFGRHVAANVKMLRAARGLNQHELAARMRELGHSTWSHTAVSNVEKKEGGREVNVDEFFSLCFALTALPTELLLPHGSDQVVQTFPGFPEHLPIRQWLESAFRAGWDQMVLRMDQETGEIRTNPETGEVR